jgi:2'-5' RNA ligase
MHLAMSILGAVEAEPEERLRQTLAEVQVPPFFLPIQGVGVFGGSAPSVVWAGIGKGHPHFFALHHHIQDAVLRAGIEPDLRPFHPHITVGRMRDVSRAALDPFLRAHKTSEFGLWKVTEFVLFSTTFLADGATYAIELRQPLH